MIAFLDGATGFVGRNVAHELVARGYDVVALVRPGSPRRASLSRRVRCLEGALEQPHGWRRELAPLAPDVAIHLAWDVTPGAYLHSDRNAACAENSRQWLDAVAAAGCRRWVMIGTCLEYAAADQPLSEEDTLAPATEYARCKDAVRRAAEALAGRVGATLSWCRLFQLYGPGEDARRLVPQVVRGLLADERVAVSSGEQMCDFLHVEDAGAAIARVASLPVAGPINVASGRAISVRAVIARIARELHRLDRVGWGERPTAPGMPRYLAARVRRLRGELGWRPRWSLAGGLRQTIGWWRERLPVAAGVAS